MRLSSMHFGHSKRIYLDVLIRHFIDCTLGCILRFIDLVRMFIAGLLVNLVANLVYGALDVVFASSKKFFCFVHDAHCVCSLQRSPPASLHLLCYLRESSAESISVSFFTSWARERSATKIASGVSTI